MFDPGAAIIWWAPGFDMPHRDTRKEGGEVTTLQGHQLNNFLENHEIKKLLVRRMVRVSHPPSPPRSANSDGKLTKANQGIFKYEVFLSQVVVMVEWITHRTLEK